ncbi:hypothetical protein [Flavobacterium sp. MMS24-S5]|uniref:hypothetical protein n=1 Tax=Flavobacterium sp. MMS24-S5 TaxID=3416605 RepID=UPI003D086E14
MKNAFKIKNKFFYITIVTLMILSCNRNKEKNIVLNPGEKVVDTTKGVYIKYPLIECVDYLEEKNEDKIIQTILEKRITKDSINYYLKVRSYKKKWSSWNQKLIICRYVQDYEPILDSKLDVEIEKKFFKTPKNTFVVKFEYGTSHVTWNYMFQIDDFNKKLCLKDIFFIEKYKNMEPILQDTLAYIAKIKIDKEMNHLSTQKIDSLFNYLDKVKDKEEKWIVK